MSRKRNPHVIARREDFQLFADTRIRIRQAFELLAIELTCHSRRRAIHNLFGKVFPLKHLLASSLGVQSGFVEQRAEE